MANREDIKQFTFSFTPAVVTPRGDGSFIVKPGRPVVGPQTLTVAQVATELGVTERHVLDLIEEGKIEAFNVGGSGRKFWRVKREAVEKFLRDRSNGAG